MARIDTIRVTKQADVDVELAKRSRNKQLREAVSMSERHAPFSSQGKAHGLAPPLAHHVRRSLPVQPPWLPKGHDFCCQSLSKHVLPLGTRRAAISEQTRTRRKSTSTHGAASFTLGPFQTTHMLGRGSGAA